MYRAAHPSTLVIEPLDELTAVYHRTSGITHMLAPPAPELLRVLRAPGTLDEALERLGEEFDLADGDRAALAARVGELVAAGLVTVEADRRT